TSFRGLWVAVRAMLALTVVLGIAYPLVITGIGQLVLPWQSNGSLVRADGATVGSSLIGQSFSDSHGKPLPKYLQPRPSLAGKGYDGGSSGGSNFGPENPKLIAQIKQRKAEVARFNGVSPADVPADAVTASASWLDPHISPAYALLQVPRIAAARGLTDAAVRGVVESKIQARDLGYLGEPTVNVLLVNIALDKLRG
ncbi:MAG: potassium-transporting ATPase subunit KdpC, partial [Lacisediminihabitans sp.]